MAKIENFPLCIGYSCTTLRVKNLLKITLSHTVFDIVTLFHFPQKSKTADKTGENCNFSPLHRILSYYPAGPKFVRNRSISYGFRDIHTFSFSAKIQDGRQKWRISYGFRDIHTFSFSAKIQDGHQKWRKLKIFPLCIGYSCTTLRINKYLKIALSLMVFEIFILFHFLLKSKMAAKSGEN